MMKAQQSDARVKWGYYYRLFMYGIFKDDNRHVMREYRREAALERKLAAAQRTIEAQEQRIEELENDVDAFELERDQREAFEALVEFTNEDFSE